MMRSEYVAADLPTYAKAPARLVQLSQARRTDEQAGAAYHETVHKLFRYSRRMLDG